jgi:lipoprotein signal peptidase
VLSSLTEDVLEPKGHPFRVRLAILAGAIILFDTLLKIVAFSVLKEKVYIPVFSDSIGLNLQLNASIALAPISNTFSGLTKHPSMAITYGIVYLAFALALGFGWRLRLKWALKVLVLAGAFVVVFFVSRLLGDLLAGLHTTLRVSLTFMRIGLLSMYVAAFSVCRRKPPQYIWAVLIAAGFSNMIGLLYPPFSVVDYLYFSLPNSDTAIVLNMADICILVSVLALIGYGILRILTKLLGKTSAA